jgi:cytochrome c peroxidase
MARRGAVGAVACAVAALAGCATPSHGADAGSAPDLAETRADDDADAHTDEEDLAPLPHETTSATDAARADTDAAALPALSTAYRWALPEGLAAPRCADAPGFSAELVTLGRRLFYNPRLSTNGRVSCASCHDQARGFSVPEPTSAGALGAHTPRNAQPLANVGYAAYLTWSNLTLLDLAQQMLVPLFGDNPVELGAGYEPGSDVRGDTAPLARLVLSDAELAAAFDAAFPTRAPLGAPTWEDVIAAIAAFECTLVSLDAPYDRYVSGDRDALGPAAQRGMALFFGDRLRCGTCHSGRFLSAAFSDDAARPARSSAFANNGLYNIDGPVSYLSGARTHYPPPNIGLGEFTQDPADDGKFRVPSLRNVERTAPSMHDGSLATLDAVLDHYARGGTLTRTGQAAGDGALHPAKDPRISGFALTEGERADLLAFLASLTDVTFLARSELGPP